MTTTETIEERIHYLKIARTVVLLDLIDLNEELKDIEKELEDLEDD